MRQTKTAMPSADILVVGAGIIGMSLALELLTRGAEVLLLERAGAGERIPGMASWAAAGMIAAEDPYHPPALQELSRWSDGLYDSYLERIEMAGGGRVSYQTQRTRQIFNEGDWLELHERSLDPRELFSALRKAVAKNLRPEVTVGGVLEEEGGVVLNGALKERFDAAKIVWANGAWLAPWVRPRKGQMMRVKLAKPMDVVTRAEHIYVVPRTTGEQAGTALIGATVEDAGFDVAVEEDALLALKNAAGELVPEVIGAEMVESWAGLRPSTVHALPVMGMLSPRQFVSGGHFRNGILLAPGSAVAMADLIEGKEPAVNMAEFAVSGSLQRV